MESFIQMRLENQRQHAVTNRKKLVKMTQEKDISLASHDDATLDHVRDAIAEKAILGSTELTMLNFGQSLTFKGIGRKIYNIKLLKTQSLAQQDF